MLKDLIDRGLIDCVAMDIKAPLHREKYEQISGVPCNIEDIKKSIRIIMESGIEYEFRTTVCPTQLDGDDIEAIARSIQGAGRYIIQSFKPNHCLDTKMLNIEPYPVETLGISQRAPANMLIAAVCVAKKERFYREIGNFIIHFGPSDRREG